MKPEDSWLHRDAILSMGSASSGQGFLQAVGDVPR